MKVPKNIQISSPIVQEEISHGMTEEEVQVLIDLKFEYENLDKNVHYAFLVEKTSIEDDGVIELSDFF